jgi:hypothetical protein
MIILQRTTLKLDEKRRRKEEIFLFLVGQFIKNLLL